MPAPFPLNLLLILIGVAVMAIGYSRARGPWQRYQALKAQEANIARYESWRGGLRDAGPTGASVAMEMARKEARIGALVIAAGFVITIIGFLLP
jgi:tetrahydromethanopterin S-methyltransferase subunit E